MTRGTLPNLPQGAVEPSNPLKINAFDLCEHCATDVPAAERRYQAQVDRAAERERQAAAEAEWARELAQLEAAEAVSHSCACIGSPCLRHCV
eukprot:COSAG01_NODE_20616_length_945_cov_0.864066_2_plen_91_part_01